MIFFFFRWTFADVAGGWNQDMHILEAMICGLLER